MKSRTVTNVLLAVIAISLAGPQVVDLTDRHILKPVQSWAAERARRKECESNQDWGWIDWGVVKVGKRSPFDQNKVDVKLPDEIAVENCKLKRLPTISQISKEWLRAQFPSWGERDFKLFYDQ